jgi:hypothetical protein
MPECSVMFVRNRRSDRTVIRMLRDTPKLQKCRCRIEQKNASLKPFEIAFRGRSNWPHYADHPRLDYADP